MRNVRVHETALSDHAGIAKLLVPDDDGLARIASSDTSDAVSAAAESELGVRTELGVQTRTLDSFSLVDVGFLKIDAEGHELAVPGGAHETITTSRPVAFVESESRHALRRAGQRHRVDAGSIRLREGGLRLPMGAR